MTRNPFGLPRAYRLRAPAAFRATTRTGLKLRDALFTVYAAPNGLAIARLGIAVSRRVSAKAVERNRIKRHIRESFRLNQDMLAGLDLVVIAHSATAGAPNLVLTHSLERHWRTAAARCVRS